jgi:hypothetical protein
MEIKVDKNTLFGDYNAITRNRPYIDKDGRAKISVYQGGDINDPRSYTQKLIDNDMAIFTPEEWKAIDTRLREIAASRQVGIAKLKELGLVYNLANPFASQSLEYMKTSDMHDASVNMNFKVTNETDKQAVKTASIPIPVISWRWGFDIRELQMSRLYNRPLDLQGAKVGARKIGEKLESMMFGANATILDDKKIDSIISFADSNKIATLHDWNATDTTTTDILDDVIALKKKSIEDKHFGKWILFVAQNYEARLDDDYGVDATTKAYIPLIDRIKKINGILDVIISDFLPDDTVALVQMTNDTIELINGMELTTVQLMNAGGLNFEMLSFVMQTPAVKSDYDGNCGIVIGTYQ